MTKTLVKCSNCSAGMWNGSRCKCKARIEFEAHCQFCGEMDIRSSPAIKSGLQKTTCIACRNLFAKINARQRAKSKKVLKINQKNYKSIVEGNNTNVRDLVS